MEYGDDFIGWLSYATHKKETMEYIEELENLKSILLKEIESLQSKIDFLNIKLKDRNKVIKKLKKDKEIQNESN